MGRRPLQRGAKVRRGSRRGPRRSLQLAQCWLCDREYRGWYPVRQHRGSSPRRFCSPDHAREYWLRVDMGVRRRRHKLLLCPRTGKLRRVRAEAVYCSTACRVRAWLERKRAAANAKGSADSSALGAGTKRFWVPRMFVSRPNAYVPALTCVLPLRQWKH